MTTSQTYYVIAPISGLHLDFDYRMYSAEIYGSPPNYTPYPEACPEFRQPYQYLGGFTFAQYIELSQKWKIDNQTLSHIANTPNRKLRDLTCIAFELELDRHGYTLISDEKIDQYLFQYIIDKGERFLDAWRLCLFKPGDDFSMGSFGAIGGGIQCFWLGQDDIAPKFIARKTSRYHLVQRPIDVLLSEFGPIYADITFRGLCAAAFYYPSDKVMILKRISEALRAFRESRDIESLESRFRHLAAIAEELAKKSSKERLKGDLLRERITKISVNGWSLYTHYGASVLTPPNLAPNQYKLIRKRYQEIGWEDEVVAKTIIKDLWDNVRNPLAHSTETFNSLERNPINDFTSMERIVVTMINGIHTAYEVEDLYNSELYDILLNDD